MSNTKMSRRRFLRRSVAATTSMAAFPYLITSSAMGKSGGIAPSERITLGFIGVGKQARSVMIPGFLAQENAQIVAVCDVDKLKAKESKDKTEKYYAEKNNVGAYKGCKIYHDFRDLLADPGIDAVVISTPDHWHAIPSIMAAQAGKDIYCEKPLSLTIDEARAMVKASRRYGRVFQTGSMQRSDQKFRFGCELVRSGYIGEIKHVAVNVGGPPRECELPGLPVPAELDWDLWLGPAPFRPYHPDLAFPVTRDGFPNFRSFRDFAGGGMTDWGAHHFDIAQWGLGMDGSGPVEVHPPDNKNYKVLTYKYANGIPMTREGNVNGVLFTGTEGTVEVNRGYLRTEPESLLTKKLGSSDVHLYNSVNHYDDWLKCIKTRTKPICDVEIGASSATVCHLGNLAYYLNRSLKWDPEKYKFIDDDGANRELSRVSRSPWHL